MPYKDPTVAKQKAAERYLKNKEDRSKKAHIRYLERREELIKKNGEYAQANREKVLAYQREYRKENSEKSKEYKKQYYQENRQELLKKSSEYLKNNPEGQKKRNKKYRGTEKGKVKTQVIRNARRKRERIASLGMIDHKLILEIYEKCKEISKTAGARYEVDHIIPISHPDVCGLHVAANLQIIPSKDNRKKSNKFILGGGVDIT